MTERKKTGPATKFRSEYVKMARELSLLGSRDADIARVFNIGHPTLIKWRNVHPELAEAMQAGRDSTGQVVVSLLKRAKGFKRKSEKIMTVSIGNGMSEVVRVPITEYYPPDVTACLQWLKRHRPDVWGDAGRGTIRPADAESEAAVEVPASVLRMLVAAAEKKNAAAQ